MAPIDSNSLLALLDAARDVLLEVGGGDGSAALLRTDVAEPVRVPLAAIVHPDDVAVVEAALTTPDATASFSARAGGRRLDWTCRRDGERWLCLGRDAEHAARLGEAQGFLAAVTDHMAEGLYTVDHKGRLTYMNPAAERMLGWRGDELLGRSIHDVIHHTRANGDPHPREECPMAGVLREQVTVRVEEDVFVRRNGSLLPVSYSSAPLFTTDGPSGSVVVFSDISERKTQQLQLLREIDELAWVTRVQDTLRDGRFVLHAQPIVHLGTRRVVQHELLLRMRLDGQLIAPGEFLPTAEKYGLIHNIDRWVIWEAARLAADGVPVELNISAETCGSPDLLETFDAALRAAGASPENLVVEITETALMKGDAADELVAGLTAMGIDLALDDFGTGYGGLTYLKRLPVRYLKIDREFIRDVRTDRASRHVVEAVVTLARGFGQKTIAEGVEDPETLAILAELGVDFAQGYHLGRPAPVESVLVAWEA